jgi:multidrug efflux pump subunit AcrA (membrane-fusion protein)
MARGERRARSAWQVFCGLLICIPQSAIGISSSGCGAPDPAAGAAEETGEKDGPVRVRCVRPEKQTLRREVRQPGQVEAFFRTPVHARLSGYVSRVDVDIDDPVRGPRTNAFGQRVEGEELARLRVPELEEEAEGKRLLVAQAEAEITQAQQAVEAARANVRSAAAKVAEAEAGLARADADVDRWTAQEKRETELADKKVIDPQVLEETKSQLSSVKAAKKEVAARVRSAQALRDESDARARKAEADVAVARAKRDVADAVRRRLEALLGYTTVRAPFDGVVTRRQVDPGHLVQPAAAGEKGEPLFVVTRTNPVRVFVEVPEEDAVWVTDKTAVRVRVPALEGVEFPSVVTRSSWALDPRTRTLRTAIDLPNPDRKLRPGMYAQIFLLVAYPGRRTLPAKAVFTQGDAAFCVRVIDGKARRTPIKIGLSGGGLVEVLQRQGKPARPGEPARWERFSDDEDVVVDQPAELKDGQEVIVSRS